MSENTNKGCDSCKKTPYHGSLNKNEMFGIVAGIYIICTSVYGSISLVKEIMTYFK
jgi:hypothetical protein